MNAIILDNCTYNDNLYVLFNTIISGIWKNREELLELRQTDKIFKPNEESQLYYQYAMRQWKRAVERFKNWY